jgi:hypothetical protein
MALTFCFGFFVSPVVRDTLAAVGKTSKSLKPGSVDEQQLIPILI